MDENCGSIFVCFGRVFFSSSFFHYSSIFTSYKKQYTEICVVTLAFSLEYRKKYITLCHDKITNMNFAFLVEFLLLVARATVHTTVQNTCLLYSFILIHIYLSWVFFYIQFCSIADSKQISQSQSETKTEYTHAKNAPAAREQKLLRNTTQTSVGIVEIRKTSKQKK